MIILAIESSCDETSAAVVREENGRFTILSNAVRTQIPTHRLYGGVVPEIAGRAHIEAVSAITYEALSEAGVAADEIELVAVTSNPGLIGALLVGVNFAKAFAVSRGIPLVAVDHIKGHLSACFLGDGEIPKPPFLALACSGGHTAIYRMEDETTMKEIGTTRDDAIGESFDKIGRMIGIPYPAGAGFDALAKEGFIEATGDEKDFYKKYKKSAAYRDRAYALPSPAIPDGSLDFSFSGLKTAAINLLHHFEQTGEPFSRSLLAARYTYEAVEAVAKKISLALEQNPEMDLVCAGGVAANSHLRARLAEVAKEHRVRLFIPPLSLCGDNGAMIAAAGYFLYKKGVFADASLNASAMDSEN